MKSQEIIAFGRRLDRLIDKAAQHASGNAADMRASIRLRRRTVRQTKRAFQNLVQAIAPYLIEAKTRLQILVGVEIRIATTGITIVLPSKLKSSLRLYRVGTLLFAEALIDNGFIAELRPLGALESEGSLALVDVIGTHNKSFVKRISRELQHIIISYTKALEEFIRNVLDKLSVHF